VSGVDVPPTGPRLLTIGEFSRLTRLSVRMLRYYDEHDVLRPSHVDRRSGYRRYDAALLETAGTIRRLRDVGLGVAELAACAAVLDDPAAVRRVLERHRSRLVAEQTALAGRVTGVDDLITHLEGTAMPVTVTRRTIPAHLVASVRDVIPTYADERVLWERLMPGLARVEARVAPDARAIAVFHDEDYRETDCDVEVRLRVSVPFADVDGVRSLEIPDQDVAVGVLIGSYEGMGAAMEDVGRWIAQEGLAIAGPMYNIYLVSPQQDPDPTHWVTEVCVPVTAASDEAGHQVADEAGR
jgi:DNA-binding transcriptional MerR regulator